MNSKYIFALVVIKDGSIFAKPFVSKEKDIELARKEAELENRRNYPQADVYLEAIGTI